MVRTLTYYEHPEDTGGDPYTEDDLYTLLVDIQNNWDELVTPEDDDNEVDYDEDDAPKKKKFVIRHHWRQWVDIVVEAEDEDEAFELADEKYNNGDYAEEPDNFENTEVENVTEMYDNNGLPY